MDAYVSHVPPPMWVYRTNIPKTRNMSEREVSCALAPQSQQPFRDFITFRCQYVSALDAEIPEHVKQTVLQYLPLLNGFMKNQLPPDICYKLAVGWKLPLTSQYSTDYNLLPQMTYEYSLALWSLGLIIRKEASELLRSISSNPLPQSLKTCYRLLCTASGVFEYIAEYNEQNFIKEHMTILETLPSTAAAFAKLSFIEAQMMVVRRAILEGNSPNTIGNVCAYIACQVGSVRDELQRTADILHMPLIKSDVRLRIMDSYLVNVGIAYQAYSCQMLMAKSIAEGNYGKATAYVEESVGHLPDEKAMKQVAKDMPELSSFFSTAFADVRRVAAQLILDNEQIYHEHVLNKTGMMLPCTPQMPGRPVGTPTKFALATFTTDVNLEFIKKVVS